MHCNLQRTLQSTQTHSLPAHFFAVPCSLLSLSLSLSLSWLMLMYHPLLLSGMTWKNALQFPSQSLWQFCNSSKSKWADSSLIKRTSGYFINSWVAEVISRCAFSLNTNLTFQLQHCSCFRGVRSTRPWRAVLQLLTSTGRHWFYQVGITHSIKLLPTSVPLAFFLYPPPLSFSPSSFP